MKYFYKKNELHGTDCHEFYFGKWNGQFWNEDSVYIYDEDFAITGLKNLLSRYVEDYSQYDATEIYPDDWKKICDNARLTARDAVKEAAFWVRRAFEEHGVFTILGI